MLSLRYTPSQHQHHSSPSTTAMDTDHDDQPPGRLIKTKQ